MISGGVLLAAGAARRFGGDKLLQPLRDGLPVCVAATRVLAQAVPQLLAVVRPGQREVSAQLAQTGATIVSCPDAVRGMGASLACGIAAAPESWDGYLVMLADLPRVRAATCIAVAAALEAGGELVVPVFRGRRGHPVGFRARYRGQLLDLDGDVGGRTILERYADAVTELAVDDPGIIADVDTPADMAAI